MRLSVPWFLHSASDRDSDHCHTEIKGIKRRSPSPNGPLCVSKAWVSLSLWLSPHRPPPRLPAYSPCPPKNQWKNILSLPIHWFSLKFHNRFLRLLIITLTGVYGCFYVWIAVVLEFLSLHFLSLNIPFLKFQNKRCSHTLLYLLLNMYSSLILFQSLLVPTTSFHPRNSSGSLVDITSKKATILRPWQKGEHDVIATTFV